MPLLVLAAVAVLTGCADFYGSPAYSQNYFAVSTPNFAFSFGEGVNAYYAPSFGGYIYGYNGYYFRWMNGSWLYASVYPGPWYSLPPNFILPGVLAYGPPPPVVSNRPYFDWWRVHVSPWYITHHPEWYRRNSRFMNNYRNWHSHVNRYYYNRPSSSWGLKRYQFNGHYNGKINRYKKGHGNKNYGRYGH